MLNKKNIKRIIIVTSLTIFIYCIAVITLYYNQEKLLFPATKLAQDHQFNFPVPFDEKMITVNGGKLNALHFRQENPKGVVFFLHGNAGSLQTWTSNVEFYQQINYDLFIFDYRGYGKSTGKIKSEKELLNDVEIAWRSIADDYIDKKVVIYGRSLGTALATSLAAKINPDLLVLVSPFTSIIDMTQIQYPILPQWDWLIRYPLRSDQWIKDVHCDILFIHGNQDKFIPVKHSQRLQSLATAPTKLLLLEQANHNNIHQFDEYYQAIRLALP